MVPGYRVMKISDCLEKEFLVSTMQGKSTRTTMNRVSSRLQLDDLDESNHNNGKQKNLQTDSL